MRLKLKSQERGIRKAVLVMDYALWMDTSEQSNKTNATVNQAVLRAASTLKEIDARSKIEHLYQMRT